MDYKKAGVDIEAGYKSVELMKKHVKATMRPEVLGGLGGFAGAFDLSAIKNMEEPILLSGTDGCGTKVKLAFVMDKHDTIGIDAVAMCVNDIACSGGEPLFFLDYIACGKNYPEKIATIVSGVAEGCIQSGCALVGGETAEHPGLMPEDDYDIAGFAVGVVDKKDFINGENIKAGEVSCGNTDIISNNFAVKRHVQICPYVLPDGIHISVRNVAHGTVVIKIYQLGIADSKSCCVCKSFFAHARHCVV
jgi:phosphoribosylformylglycinamidine cyclo-ligase